MVCGQQAVAGPCINYLPSSQTADLLSGHVEAQCVAYEQAPAPVLGHMHVPALAPKLLLGLLRCGAAPPAVHPAAGRAALFPFCFLQVRWRFVPALQACCHAGDQASRKCEVQVPFT